LWFTNRGEALHILPEFAGDTRVCQVCGLRRALPLALITKAKNGKTINVLATTHGPSAELLCEGEGRDVDRGNAAGAPEATAAAAAMDGADELSGTVSSGHPCFGLVDSAREENKARAVEIYLNRGR